MADMATRRRVLIGAYACGPVEEPEASAGWAYAVAAAQHADVWVVTRKRFAEPVESALQADPELARRLTVIHMDLPDRVRARWKHSWDLYWYYALWQRELTRVGRRLHAEHRFDVLHHVTFANDWLPCGLAAVQGPPLVWGPVGGASDIPYWKLRRWLGPRGFATEIIRDSLTFVPRAIWGDKAARRAGLVIAQNRDVARRFSRLAETVIEPNAALDEVPAAGSSRPVGTRKRAVFAGRLVGLKGVRLCLDVLAHPSCRDWDLDLYGDGWDRRSLERWVRRAGLSDRVRFLGHRPRSEVLAAFETADAMLFPSMHDQAGWVVAEASSLGCPVVCLPLGGPPLLAQPNDFVVSLDGDIVENAARELIAAGQATATTRHDRWSRQRIPDLVERWYDQVAAGGPQRSVRGATTSD